MFKSTIVVETKIKNADFECINKLSSLYSHIQRTLYNQISNNKLTKEFRNKIKKEYILKYGIHARMFNSLWSETKAKYDALKELHKVHKSETKKQIGVFKKKIKGTKSKLKKKNTKEHQKTWLKSTLFKHKNKLNKLNKKLKKEFNSSLVFGTRDFYKKQWTDEKYIENHDLWRKEWNRKRNSHFFFLGSKDESNGNQMCQYLKEEETLRITLPYCLQKEGVKYIEIPVQFNSDKEKKNEQYFNYFHEAHENKQALSYRFLQKENGFWYIQVSFNIYSEAEKAYNGTIGIDLNYDLITTTEVDRHGNKVGIKNYKYESENLTSEQANDILSKIILDIVKRAKEQNRNISMEDLNLSDCKSSKDKKKNRKISLISYSSFKSKIEVKCCKESTELKIVNPAYSSIIGRHKYSKFYGISVHNSAALVIARRANRFKDRVPSQICGILQRGEAYESFLKIRRYRHHWSHWNFVHKHIKNCSPRLNRGDSFLVGLLDHQEENRQALICNPNVYVVGY